jgi:hypothetical protein
LLAHASNFIPLRGRSRSKFCREISRFAFQASERGVRKIYFHALDEISLAFYPPKRKSTPCSPGKSLLHSSTWPSEASLQVSLCALDNHRLLSSSISQSGRFLRIRAACLPKGNAPCELLDEESAIAAYEGLNSGERFVRRMAIEYNGNIVVSIINVALPRN